ncbi:MAG: hypothetical protein DWP98_13550 [Bacteroidetes bacterium]|nr:MAG: hypothetical protein DWP98_13550 [Bacteroidota bacterium]MBL1145032.1 hypothetical protein [Bacteroidota bacterium]NOG57829.1 hypothetical protein [Bacteroidota bacterium]
MRELVRRGGFAGNDATIDDKPFGANVIVGGTGNDNEEFTLSFCDLPNAGEDLVMDFAEIKITLDDAL